MHYFVREFPEASASLLNPEVEVSFAEDPVCWACLAVCALCISTLLPPNLICATYHASFSVILGTRLNSVVEKVVDAIADVFGSSLGARI